MIPYVASAFLMAGFIYMIFRQRQGREETCRSCIDRQRRDGLAFHYPRCESDLYSEHQ